MMNSALEKVHGRLTRIRLLALAYLRYQMIFSLPDGLPETFRIPSGTRVFWLPTYGSTYGLTYGGQFHYLRAYLRTYLRHSLTEVPNSLNMTLGPPRRESTSFIKKSIEKTSYF